MGIKGWFEQKLLERKTKAAQKKLVAALAKRQPETRFTNHNASKKGYKHYHSAGFITKFVMRIDGRIVRKYKHGDTYGKFLLSNHERTVSGRKRRNPGYLA